MDLLKLNKKFYLKTQKYFNTSRQSPWPGWKKLLPHLQVRNLQVLDLGCGNGRFGKFLAEHRQIDYTGIDNNQYLLDRCGEVLPHATLINQDLLKPWPIKEKPACRQGRFDLIVLFAVLHHIPTAADRLKILQRAKKLLKSNGLLIFTTWQFDRSKIVKKIARNDYLLYWKKGITALRYCHRFTKKEVQGLIKALKLKLLADFIADTSNRYLILQK
ncbi:MAG: hypothetical protein UV54_C0026G0008 [Candidatus Beckwithbacteria bacterium GW2011_GWA2_43_10]|uniref:Uncharacterized protein n=1 Tax=Candidatus Beckwithbacteria bacterium GW2011_GWA2_43_10 TaxID=1618369 RepID=A0A0G1C2K1_9BACT|nr:MAG: hypothetical protein UV54_C0026G0008 [Candidatus Beckwithbacteria bacterium GW2011_GWA2_43_10]